MKNHTASAFSIQLYLINIFSLVGLKLIIGNVSSKFENIYFTNAFCITGERVLSNSHMKEYREIAYRFVTFHIKQMIINKYDHIYKKIN